MSFLLISIFFVISLFIALVAFFTLVAVYSAAPYVPTHAKLVEKMLDMAEVSGEDVVVDLGAGDGRIVAAAALRGARAVGYEINPVLVLVSNVRLWWLKSKFQNPNFKRKQPDYPRIIWGNFWSKDLSSATVITIFGFPNMMGRLEEKLQKELKPGSRVVSHAFRFPNWPPVKREEGLLLYELK